MFVTGTSDYSSSLKLRTAVSLLQKQMAQTQIEASTGKIADRAMALGLNSATDVGLNQQVQRLDTIKTLNATVSGRLDATQTTLTTMSSIVTDMIGTLVQAKSGGVDFAVIQQKATAALQSLNDKLNTSYNGQYLFAGVNTDVMPVAANPDDATSAGKVAVETSFAAAFGMSPSDPGVANIDPASMNAFLDGSFSQLFDDTGWRTNFSSASDKTIRSRISVSEVVDGSVSADASAFRQVTQALTMISQLGLKGMGDTTKSALIDKAMSVLTTGQASITAMQTSVGGVQTRVSDATDRLTIQSQNLSKSIGAMEDVDPYAVSMQFSSLSTQIQTAYSITARIQQLSILKYL